MVALTKVVSSAGKWTISWNRTSHATSMAFPHCTGELTDYAEYIVTSPLSLQRDSFISPGFEDFFSVVTLKFDFLPQK